MQQRFHLLWFNTYEKAIEAKRIFQAENPDINYQIRRKQKGYEVVKRLPVVEAKKIRAKD